MPSPSPTHHHQHVTTNTIPAATAAAIAATIAAITELCRDRRFNHADINTNIFTIMTCIMSTNNY